MNNEQKEKIKFPGSKTIDDKILKFDDYINTYDEHNKEDNLLFKIDGMFIFNKLYFIYEIKFRVLNIQLLNEFFKK